MKKMIAAIATMLLLMTACAKFPSDDPAKKSSDLLTNNTSESSKTLFERFFEKPIRAQDDSGLWGYINIQGDWVIQPQFADAGGFSCDRAEVVDAETGLHGFIDTKGNYIVEPQYYEANAFSEGYAAVATSGDSEYDIYYDWGFIDTNGNAITDFIYDDVLAFHDGLAAVTEAFEYGYIDTAGKIVIPYMFTGVTNFTNERALVASSGLEYGHMIDKNGNQLTDDCYQPSGQFHTIDSPHYTSNMPVNSDGSFHVMKCEFTESGGSHRYSTAIDIDGKDISPYFTFEYPSQYSDEFLICSSYDKDGYAWVAMPDDNPNNHVGTLSGVVDRDLNWVLEPTYDSVIQPLHLEDNFFAHDINTDLWGIASVKSGWVVEPAFTGINEVHDNYAILSKGNQLYYYNKHSGSLSPNSLDATVWEINNFWNEIPYAVDLTTGRKYLLTSDFDILNGDYGNIDTSLLYVDNVYDKTGIVGSRDSDGHMGIIDFQGNWLIDPKFKNIKI